MERTLAIVGIAADVFSILTDIATAGAAIIVAWIAYRGLGAWRDEMRGRRKAELAEEVLAAFYETRDVFHWVRNPGGFGGEADARPREEGEEEDLARQLDAYFVPLARLQDNRALLSGLHAKRYRFRALFGADADNPFQTFRDVEAEIVSAANVLARLAQNEARRARGAVPARALREEVVREEDHRRQVREARIWDAGEPDDDINRRLDAAVADMEEMCRPAIEARAK
ncbi:hypothetical protein P2H44_07565 [Albimonas sp. CAU 1670]|uniref:hypothetical protein n=1 Tax=Albimonas sp. CAU 1670 TaxID=3032599 RepID=UPI0023DC0E1C|nr:hypothetical protein [Albimonas sp. CAU 1670]MDF2232410.1 hypothetical protein [Albimonas sp. CAU 1670]